MTRPLLLLASAGFYFAFALALRALIHAKKTGKSGIVGLSGPPGSLEWWGGTLFVLASLLIPVGSGLALLGLPLSFDAPSWTLPLGLAAVAVGTVGTLAAQSNMGASWRVGVPEGERTGLVVAGIYSLVRNPIFSFLLLACAGFALVFPSAYTLLSLALFVAAIQIQVRFVEEPWLAKTHGEPYHRYCQEVGRFVPFANWG